MSVLIEIQDETVEVTQQEEQATIEVDSDVVVVKEVEEMPVYIRVSGGYIQYSNDNETWTNVIALSELKGADGKDGATGKDGKNGEDGTDGVGIQSVVQTTTATTDGGDNVFTVTLTNGNKTTFTVKNGSKGSTGANGDEGGHYTPQVTIEEDAIKIVWYASKQSLPALPPSYIPIPENGSDASVTAENIKIALGYTPAEQTKVSQLEGQIDDQQTEINNKQPKGNYALKSELEAETTAREQAVASLNARLGQQTVLVAEGKTQAEAEAWLETSGDKTKAYLMPDDTFWAYRGFTEVVEGGVSYTNRLPLATDTDRTTIYGGDYNGDGVNDGYKTNTRLSGSSGSESSNNICHATGFIPVVVGDVVRIKHFFAPSSVGTYIVSYDASNAKLNNQNWWAIEVLTNGFDDWYSDYYANNHHDWYDVTSDGITTVSITEALFGSGVNAIRISGIFDENTVITVNEEIKESSGTTTVVVEKWATTGHGLVATDYDEVIANLTNITNAHTKEIQGLKELVKTGIPLTDDEKLKKIKNWDKPVYDYSAITLLPTERAKPALTASDRTVDAVYAKYRALMAKYPRYITETNLGKSTASDTFEAMDILRFDFKEPDGLVESSRYTVNETKPKIIIMTGVHREFAGIYGLYYALEEIAENPDFDDIRRNAHIIVIPCSNPHCLDYKTTIEGWQMSHVNANGVAIHNNFGVEHNTYNADASVGEFNYGGTEPYSELETQYIDKVMSENSDAIAFLTCHNYNNDIVFGSLAIWASSATAYMCNLAYRLIDKISKAWHNKYGSSLQEAIDTYKTDALPDGETRLGWAQFSTSAGTEQLNATKYGIQATNLEISDNMRVFSNAQFSSDVMTHGAEVYANYLRIILSSYNHTDKEQYYK